MAGESWERLPALSALPGAPFRASGGNMLLSPTGGIDGVVPPGDYMMALGAPAKRPPEMKQAEVELQGLLDFGWRQVSESLFVRIYAPNGYFGLWQADVRILPTTGKVPTGSVPEIKEWTALSATLGWGAFVEIGFVMNPGVGAVLMMVALLTTYYLIHQYSPRYVPDHAYLPSPGTDTAEEPEDSIGPGPVIVPNPVDTRPARDCGGGPVRPDSGDFKPIVGYAGLCYGPNRSGAADAVEYPGRGVAYENHVLAVLGAHNLPGFGGVWSRTPGGMAADGNKKGVEYDGLVTQPGKLLPPGTLVDAKDWNTNGWKDPAYTVLKKLRTEEELADEAAAQVARQRAGMQGTTATGLVWVFSDAKVAAKYEQLLSTKLGRSAPSILVVSR